VVRGGVVLHGLSGILNNKAFIIEIIARVVSEGGPREMHKKEEKGSRGEWGPSLFIEIGRPIHAAITIKIENYDFTTT
jgi:hypothetical protein